MNKTELKKTTKKVLDHWEDNVEKAAKDRTVHTGCQDCSYCNNFLFQYETCKGCPVFEDTGIVGCQETPWVRTKNLALYRFMAGEGKLLEACWDEYLYLLNVAYSQDLI